MLSTVHPPRYYRQSLRENSMIPFHFIIFGKFHAKNNDDSITAAGGASLAFDAMMTGVADSTASGGNRFSLTMYPTN